MPPRRPQRAPQKRSSKRYGARDESSDKRGYKSKGRDKRTSKNTDDRNPTRSGIQHPTKKYRSREESPDDSPRPRPALRKKGAPKPPPRKSGGQTRKSTKPTRHRRGKQTAASEELGRIAGRNAKHAQDQLARAAAAYTEGRERDAMRLLRPLRDAYPDASAVRELMGLCHYRLGQYAAATKELEAFVELSDSVEQHPVLMDSLRAQRKYQRVEELWEELALASPSSALVTEGRIVLAGSKADRGRLNDAIATLDRRAGNVKKVQEQHLRLWYVLADLYERAGEIGRARDLFLRVRKYDASFADVAERLAALK
jgi:tetratricopeptide (TPR) repeat protein